MKYAVITDLVRLLKHVSEHFCVGMSFMAAVMLDCQCLKPLCGFSKGGVGDFGHFTREAVSSQRKGLQKQTPRRSTSLSFVFPQLKTREGLKGAGVGGQAYAMS